MGGARGYGDGRDAGVAILHLGGTLPVSALEVGRNGGDLSGRGVEAGEISAEPASVDGLGIGRIWDLVAAFLPPHRLPSAVTEGAVIAAALHSHRPDVLLSAVGPVGEARVVPRVGTLARGPGGPAGPR